MISSWICSRTPYGQAADVAMEQLRALLNTRTVNVRLPDSLPMVQMDLELAGRLAAHRSEYLGDLLEISEPVFGIGF
jgi:hypothetical protein